MSKLWNNRPKS